MSNSRLYYDIKELSTGILKFLYYTDEISDNFSDLKSYTKQLNQQKILPVLYNVGIKNMLYNMNLVEFSRLFQDVKKYKDYVLELGHTDAIEANKAIVHLIYYNNTLIL